MNSPGSPHVTGDIYGQRQGSCAVRHTYPYSFNTTGIGSGVLVDTIRASTDNPVQVEVSQQVYTAFDATTSNIVSVGTSTTANEWLATTLTGTTHLGYFPASNAVAKFRLTADTPIYVKYAQTGTAAAAGKAVVIINEYQENTAAIA